MPTFAWFLFFFFNHRLPRGLELKIKILLSSKARSLKSVIPETHIARDRVGVATKRKRGNRTENPRPSAPVHGRPLTTSHFAFSANGWQRKYRSAWTGEQSDLRFVDKCSCFSMVWNILRMCSAFLVNFVLLRFSDCAVLHTEVR